MLFIECFDKCQQLGGMNTPGSHFFLQKVLGAGPWCGSTNHCTLQLAISGHMAASDLSSDYRPVQEPLMQHTSSDWPLLGRLRCNCLATYACSDPPLAVSHPISCRGTPSPASSSVSNGSIKEGGACQGRLVMIQPLLYVQPSKVHSGMPTVTSHRPWKSHSANSQITRAQPRENANHRYLVDSLAGDSGEIWSPKYTEAVWKTPAFNATTKHVMTGIKGYVNPSTNGSSRFIATPKTSRSIEVRDSYSGRCSRVRTTHAFACCICGVARKRVIVGEIHALATSSFMYRSPSCPIMVRGHLPSATYLGLQTSEWDVIDVRREMRAEWV